MILQNEKNNTIIVLDKNNNILAELFSLTDDNFKIKLHRDHYDIKHFDYKNTNDTYHQITKNDVIELSNTLYNNFKNKILNDITENKGIFFVNDLDGRLFHIDNDNIHCTSYLVNDEYDISLNLKEKWHEYETDENITSDDFFNKIDKLYQIILEKLKDIED